MKEHYFKYPGRLPSLNEVLNKNRTNRYAGAKLKKDIQEDIIWSIREYRSKGYIRPIKESCVIIIKFTEPNQKRDIDNIQSGTKFILDAMQTAGILPNDNPKWVRDIKHIVETKPKVSQVEVEILESDTATIKLQIQEGTNNDNQCGERCET